MLKDRVLNLPAIACEDMDVIAWGKTVSEII